MIKGETHKVTQSAWLKPSIPPFKCLCWQLFLNVRSFVQLYAGYAWGKGAINNPGEAEEDVVSAAESTNQSRTMVRGEERQELWLQIN